MIASIQAVLVMVQQLFGAEVAKDLLGFFAHRLALTPEQRANLDANFADYSERIARLESEQGKG